MLRRKGIVIVPACESVCFFSSEILRCWGDVHTYFAFPRESFPFFPVAYLKKQRKQTIIFPDGKKFLNLFWTFKCRGRFFFDAFGVCKFFDSSLIHFLSYEGVLLQVFCLRDLLIYTVFLEHFKQIATKRKNK